MLWIVSLDVDPHQSISYIVEADEMAAAVQFAKDKAVEQSYRSPMLNWIRRSAMDLDRVYRP